MRERLEAMVGRAAEGVWLAPFMQSLAHPAPSRRGDRAEAELHDPRHRRSDPLLKQILQAENIDERRWPAGSC